MVVAFIVPVPYKQIYLNGFQPIELQILYKIKVSNEPMFSFSFSRYRFDLH